MTSPSRRIIRLTVEPTAGLGNRMRVIASGLQLAERLECPLRIVWTRTGALGSRFDALFAPLPGVEVVEHAWTTSRLERVTGSRLGFYHYLQQPEIERRTRGPGFDDLAASRRPYLITCTRFMPVSVHLRRLLPAPDIARCVDDVSASFTPHTVGVHIRRGENDPATHEPLTAPLASYLEAMRRRLDAEPRTGFFLATDSATEEAAVRRQFGTRVTTLPKSLDRRSPGAIRSALVDLLCLARTPVLLGSHFSSFSEVAAEIGGTELVVIQAQPGATAELARA